MALAQWGCVVLPNDAKSRLGKRPVSAGITEFGGETNRGHGGVPANLSGEGGQRSGAHAMSDTGFAPDENVRVH